MTDTTPRATHAFGSLVIAGGRARSRVEPVDRGVRGEPGRMPESAYFPVSNRWVGAGACPVVPAGLVELEA